MIPLNKFVLGISIFFAVVVTIILSQTLYSNHAAKAANTSSSSVANNSVVSSTKSGQNNRAIGLPAIQVPPGLLNSSNMAFTTKEVEDYLQLHPSVGKIISDSTPTIDSIQFLTSKEVSNRIGGSSTGVEDSRILCYVVLKGNFHISTMTDKVINTTQTIRVFDTQTGNLLMAGEGK